MDTLQACVETQLKLCATCPFIPKARLEALPTARLCVACQEAEEQHRIPSYTRQRPRRWFGEDEGEFSHHDESGRRQLRRRLNLLRWQTRSGRPWLPA